MDERETALQAERDRLSAAKVVSIEIARPHWFAHRGVCWWCGKRAVHVVHVSSGLSGLECDECRLGTVDLSPEPLFPDEPEEQDNA